MFVSLTQKGFHSFLVLTSLLNAILSVTPEYGKPFPPPFAQGLISVTPKTAESREINHEGDLQDRSPRGVQEITPLKISGSREESIPTPLIKEAKKLAKSAEVVADRMELLSHSAQDMIKSQAEIAVREINESLRSVLRAHDLIKDKHYNRSFWIPSQRWKTAHNKNGKTLPVVTLNPMRTALGPSWTNRPIWIKGRLISLEPIRPQFLLSGSIEALRASSDQLARGEHGSLYPFRSLQHRGYISYLGWRHDHPNKITEFDGRRIVIKNPNMLYLPFSLASRPELELNFPDRTNFWYIKNGGSELTGVNSDSFGKQVYLHSKTGVLATSLKCPQLSSFAPVSINDIGCSALMAKFNNIATGKLRWMKPDRVQSVGDACVARQYYVKRHCWFGFFGNKEKSESTVHSKITNITSAKQACAGMYDQVSTTYSYSTVPEYSCWWCKSTDVTGYYWRGDRISVKFHLPTATVSGDQLGATDCPVSASHGCETKMGDRVFPQSKDKYMPEPEFVEMDGECNYLETSNITQLYAEGFGAGYIYNDCWFAPFNDGEKLFGGVDGSLWDMGPLLSKCAPKATSTCTEWRGGKTISTSVKDPVLDTSWQLHEAIRDCLTRRQVIHNSLSLGNPFDSALLESISYRGAQNFVLLPYAGKLYAAKCTPVTYDNLVYRGHDIWEALLEGATVGCLDARVGAIFPDCVAYNETQVMRIDNQWNVVKEDNGYTATYVPGSKGDALRVISEVNSAIGSYLDHILNPPAYPPNFGPGATDPDTPVKTDQQLGIEIWWNNLSLFGKIGSVFGIIVGLTIGGIFCYYLTKCCCGAMNSKVRVSTSQ